MFSTALVASSENSIENRPLDLSEGLYFEIIEPVAAHRLERGALNGHDVKAAS